MVSNKTHEYRKESKIMYKNDSFINQIEALLPPTCNSCEDSIITDIAGITYECIVTKESMTNIKRAFVRMPMMSEHDMTISDRIMSSDYTIDRIVTLALTYHVCSRDYTIPILGYMIAKLSTIEMNNGLTAESIVEYLVSDTLTKKVSEALRKVSKDINSSQLRKTLEKLIFPVVVEMKERGK